MHAGSMCLSCIFGKEEKRIRGFQDEEKKSGYLHRVLELLYRYGQTESAPWLAGQVSRLYEQFWGTDNVAAMKEVKHTFNQLLLAREGEIEGRIRQSPDVLKECIKYVCAGNYIDFSAVEDVNVAVFDQLLAQAAIAQVSEAEYAYFIHDLKEAHRLVYLTDNCGEIVLDKLFIRCIRERYPKLSVTVLVRGEDILNDATMEDAREVGLTEMVRCMGNGSGAAGTVRKRLSREAGQCLSEADVIIAKGQGNFESLFGEGCNPYYFFLCKCELFVQRFGLKQFASVFMKEERMQLNEEEGLCEA